MENFIQENDESMSKVLKIDLTREEKDQSLGLLTRVKSYKTQMFLFDNEIIAMKEKIRVLSDKRDKCEEVIDVLTDQILKAIMPE
ncbi:hypothetical protein M0R19_03565 [Candidatus Pacearchaeota archaeon]|jgi:hypothetical protein|nr:hypothetical protein [Candidatus Pacearchaeota archaeon]